MIRACITCGKEHNFQKSRLLNCSRACRALYLSTKYTGRGNPNCRYKELDDSFFSSVNTEFKAYLLGWIASDGTISNTTVTIAIHQKDIELLTSLKENFCSTLPIKKKDSDLISLSINSTRIVEDVCKLLHVSPGKKSDIVCFPQLSEEFNLAFIRGFFDGDGSIVNVNTEKETFDYPKCSIVTSSSSMRESIRNILEIPCSNSGLGLYFSGNNALDLMSKLYDNATFFLRRKRNLYDTWCSWVPGLSGRGSSSRIGAAYFVKTSKDAVLPSKAHASDSGFDLTITSIYKKGEYCTLYDTGIKVMPPFGWYFDLVPRSSIIKTGYMLANSVGVIDRTYVGNVLVPLIKVDSTVPDLDLPAKVVQLIPRPIVHFDFERVEELSETLRGAGGFGSTDRKDQTNG